MESGDPDTSAKNKVELQQVLGLTVCSNSTFDSDPQTSTVAYPAGCVVVLYNVRKNKQRFIINDAKKAISALSFSWDGKYLATGECGTVAYLRVWDVQKLTLVAELSGHKHGISCVAFSPNMKYVVSVGSQHDMVVNVWDWKSKIKVACNKVSCKVKALSFSAGGNYFVTVGNNHVKFWYLEYSRSSKYKLEPVPLMGRSAILGDQRNNYFCDVACGRGESADSTFAITKSGLLCEFNSRRLLDKWVELRVSTAISISVGENYIFIGCSEGIIRCFSPVDLHFICTLPRPHYLGVDVAKGLIGRQSNSRKSVSRFPDVIAVTLDETNHKVTCAHNDHSLYVWDIRDIKKIGKSHSFLYHSACIWGIEVYPNMKEEGSLPAGTFFTCANDDTIRIWNLDHSADKQSSIKRNIYCSELLKILYTDPSFSSLCNTDLTSGLSDKQENSYDGKNGVRCLKVRSDGEHLASGDRGGNLRIYDLKYMETVCKIEAHDSEILCLEYSQGPTQLLSSASRDRLVHIFDVENNYSFLQTLDDHNASVTATKFIQHRNGLHLISCGADKSVIFRKAKPGQKPKIVSDNAVVEKTTFYDMEVDASANYVLTACQDGKIRVYDVVNGKHIRTMSGAQEEGTLIKIALDPTGTFVATSSTDKNVYIFDYMSGQCVASMSGHSELVTGLKFTPSRKQLISVSGDGCIFVWRLPPHISKPVPRSTSGSGIWQDNKKSVVAIAKPFQLDHHSESESTLSDGGSIPYQFSLGQLPSWAKKQIADDVKQTNALSKSATQPIQPRGRWAQRLDGQSLVVKSYLHTDSVIPYPSSQGEHHTEHTMIKYTSTESRNSVNLREETISHSKQISISRSSVLHEADSGPPSLSFGNKRERVRHPTDSSSASSHRCDDGDAEDERSDSGATENSEMVYYPPCEESGEVKDSSFHICAVKDEKLGYHNKRGLMHSESSFNVSDKMDSVSDGDDSTNHGEQERPALGSFSVSTENLDRFDMREKYMLDNYESLNKEPADDSHHPNRLSISSKHHSKSTYSRFDSSGRGTPNQISSTKREELTRALNDARRKLDSLGYKGSLSTSKSVGDLRNMSEGDDVASRLNSLKDDSNDMRRSTSYGDISLRNAGPRRRLPTTPHSGPQHAPLWAQAKPLNYGSEVTDSDSSKQNRFSTPDHGLRHSSSASSLANVPEPKSLKNTDNQFYTPTSSSVSKPAPGLNKSQSVLNVNAMANKNVNPGGRRLSLSGASRRLQYDDSSSSEASPTDTKSNTIVPRGIVARRMKAFCGDSVSKVLSGEAKNKRKFDREPVKSKSDWDLRDLHNEDVDRMNSKAPERPKDVKFTSDKLWQANVTTSQSHSDYIKSLEPSPMDLPVRDITPSNAANYVDINSTPLTQELCDKVSEELKRTTTFAMQLFQRITVDPRLTPSEKSMMTTTLAQGVLQAQQNLEPAASQLKPSNKTEITDPTAAMTLLQQYSDKLLSIVEQRITKGEK